MNPFLIIAAALNIGAAIWHLTHGEIKMCVVWLAYALATGIMSTVK